MRWAEALSIERLHEADTSRWVADRIDTLATMGGDGGIARFRKITRRSERTFAAASEALS